jgi:hypothetical protein
MFQKGSFLRQHFKYFDMIFNYIRQFEGVMLMTGTGILDWYKSAGPSPSGRGVTCRGRPKYIPDELIG